MLIDTGDRLVVARGGKWGWENWVKGVIGKKKKHTWNWYKTDLESFKICLYINICDIGICNIYKNTEERIVLNSIS